MSHALSLTTRVLLSIIIIELYPLGLLLYGIFDVDFWTFTALYAYYTSFLIGALSGLLSARELGADSSIGKFLVYSGLGLSSTIVGLIIWDYLDFILQVDPYPSIGDLFYLMTTVFIAIAIFFLLRAYRVDIKPYVMISGMVAFILYSLFSFWLIGTEAFSLDVEGLYIVIVNLLYVINDSLTVGIATMLLILAGGKLLKGIWTFSIGFILYALGNVVFIIRDMQGTFYIGDVSDLIFIFSGIFMSMGIILAANKLYGERKVW